MAALLLSKQNKSCVYVIFPIFHKKGSCVYVRQCFFDIRQLKEHYAFSKKPLNKGFFECSRLFPLDCRDVDKEDDGIVFVCRKDADVLAVPIDIDVKIGVDHIRLH